MRQVARIGLPSHVQEGGFDHAAVYAAKSRLYVAHTSNDSVDVVDLMGRRFSHSLGSLPGVAGVWVSEERGLLFTSNRGQDTASIFDLASEREIYRVPTGSRPNGMAFDTNRATLLVAGVGNRESAAPPTATFISASDGKAVERIDLPGRTRWSLFHRPSDAFYVNIADPPRIAQIGASDLSRIGRMIEVPASGPHGLDQDPDGRTLYCACDDGWLVEVDLPTGMGHASSRLLGPPDVIWLNPRTGHLYVAIGDPGVVQVFETHPLTPVGSIVTAAGAHTLTLDPANGEIHVFLPSTHEDLVLAEREPS